MFSIGASGRSLPRRAAEVPETLRCGPERARALLLAGRVPDALTVDGPLHLAGEARLRALPRVLTCARLDVRGCPDLAVLPEVLRASAVVARDLAVSRLAGDWLVRGPLDLSGSAALARLPERLSAASLDVSGCARLAALPDTLHLTGFLEVAGSGLRGVPPHLRGALRWRGTPVDERLAFRPETVPAREVLAARNLTRRRLLLDRVGLARFFEELGGLVLDRDTDAGGERRLLSVPLDGDEPVVVLSVRCPSTGHPYVLRVPPRLRSCHAAAAWLAGFDDARAYRPVQEA